ncbi:hypothetical protein D5R40_17910 [Okeania hirsuta]|uniref:Uncharacterized protein n=1 Tax=Okeania hirsuta TaxID=1458930 RepID=A0A3N6NVR5_9CYAN|nr:hypothetical protein D4Z78_07800 [Okeania hirsuta]RQH38024.1 hypothetical protein D5R40_17910 [Okeania hirsuta]
MVISFATQELFYRKLLNPVRLANGILDSYNIWPESALIAISYSNFLGLLHHIDKISTVSQ